MMNGAILTKRETEIAELLAWGATKKDVANRLFVSERTVENHTRNIYEKTGVTKINELSAWWFCTTFNISFDLSPLKRSAIATRTIHRSDKSNVCKDNYNPRPFFKTQRG